MDVKTRIDIDVSVIFTDSPLSELSLPIWSTSNKTVLFVNDVMDWIKVTLVLNLLAGFLIMRALALEFRMLSIFVCTLFTISEAWYKSFNTFSSALLLVLQVAMYSIDLSSYFLQAPYSFLHSVSFFFICFSFDLAEEG